MLGGPAADSVATVHEHLREPDYPRVMDLDAGIPHRSDGDRQGQPLEQREVHMDVEALRLKAGKAVGDDLESFPHCVQMIKSFLQAEVAQVVGAEFVAQVAGEFLI